VYFGGGRSVGSLSAICTAVIVARFPQDAISPTRPPDQPHFGASHESIAQNYSLVMVAAPELSAIG
jgi:hypothetical protein